MNRPYSFAILSGGQNKRFGGYSKALAEVQGIPLYVNILQASSARQNMIITNNNYERAEFLKSGLLEVYSDIIPAKGPLSGIHSALIHAREDIIVIIPSDLPLMNGHTVNSMLQYFNPESDALVPRTQLHTHPVSAVYSIRALKRLEKYLQENKKASVHKFLDVINTQYMDIRPGSSMEQSFYNMNTKEDYFKLLKAIKNENNK